MSQCHKINHLSLECDFTGFADAENFESRAAQWVVQQFLPVMETVFDEICPEHQTLVLDRLTLDLGTFSASSFYQAAPEKLRQLLQATLRSQLHASQQASDAAEPSSSAMQVLSQQQQRWNLLWQYLSTGTLPWSAAGEQTLETLGLSEMLAEHSARLINQLNHAHRPEQILQRIVEQFPDGHIAALLPSLTAAQQWTIMSLLLAHPKSRQGELADRLALAWFNRFTQAFAQHNLAPLLADWEKLLQQFSPQLIKALYQRHSDSQLPWVLLRDLTKTARLQLLRVLTPQEYPFLQAILHMPEWWSLKQRTDAATAPVQNEQALSPADPIGLLPPSQIHQQLWLFTLQFLLINRGSAFNRQSYMSGLVVQMARSQNQKADALLASLISTLNSTTIDSALRGQLLDLLHTIEPIVASTSSLKTPERAETHIFDAEVQQAGVNVAPFADINALLLALSSGQEQQILRYWPPVSSPFAALLRWCGQLEYIRRHWAETYSAKTLASLVEVLEPLATPLLRLIAEQRLFAWQGSRSSERETAAMLWQITFAFLIVESGGAFTPKNYLRYLIQRIAAWRNIAFSDQLEALRNNALSTGDLSLAGTTLSALLDELNPDRFPDESTQDSESSPSLFQLALAPSLTSDLSLTQLADIEEIVTTLQSASQTLWDSKITRWQRDYGPQLAQLILSIGLSVSSIKRWVAHFDDSALLTLTAIINSSATGTVRAIIHQSQTLGTAISHTSNSPDASPTRNRRNALWELSLHYVISRRGSEFNQYQYLLNITEQLSARYQVHVEVLINEWLSLSDSGFLWRQQLIDLVGQHTQPPVTAHQLLANIQSDDQHRVISESQRRLVQHYAAINAPALATQLQTWNSVQFTRLVRSMQPTIGERILALLPLLLAIVRQFRLTLHWFYPLLLSNDCPATPEQWLQRLLRQMNRHNAAPDAEHSLQLQQFILSSNLIHQPLAERKRWLDSLLPEERLREGLQQWFDGKAPAPATGWLVSLAQYPMQHSLRQWLQRMLANPRHMQRWLEEIAPQAHQALLLPTLTSTTLALLALRQAFCQLFASPKRGEYLFWQTLYRQHWLKGIAITAGPFLDAVLLELNQRWRSHSHQDTTPDDASVAVLIGRLLPLIPSTSQRKTLEHIARRSEQKPPDTPAWAAQLNHQQVEIKQLIEAIDMTGKDMKKDAGTPWEKPEDNAAVSTEPVTVHNAGLVVASVYIPMLFQRLALTDGRKFVDNQAQLQALFCLQWMTNNTNSAPEYQLLLNKVLCGVAPSTPIPQQVALPEGAEQLIEGLLTAIIAHWRVLGKTSVSGLQSTFIQRDGMLSFTPEHWQLNIIPGTFDMLLDQLPWSFQTIKYPWMDVPLFVSWR
ncbi:contractile injection system tape measure protein [Pectobacterium polaris]|uniref:contractile injection system tape measure protein n=1 Tax=Pectobacterium polaris TaxID=2042057 RepID=UPI002404C74A|nr:contractile injection system tape measure protein [Pectobacterium polaris]MDG0803421.1 contractile injection system tape measure protein [Pectobacterium polaris]